MSTYKLEIESNGLIYNGASTGATPIVLTNSTPVTIQYDVFNLTLSLYGLTFSRKIYEPGHIQAEVLISTKRDDVTASNNPDLDSLISIFLHRPVKLYVDSTKVVSGYFIHEISPQFEKSSKTEKQTDPITGDEKEVTLSLWSIYVRLDIFSMDKLFTLNKFSHVFLGKRLFADIVKDSVDDFPLTYSAVVNGISTDYKTKITLNSTNKLTHLGYGQNKTELVHPYLVQYNETFYAFLRRVANRCGEVFYFEGGELCFGLPDKPKDTNGNVDIPTVNDAKRVVFQRISSSPVEVEDYMRDSEKEWDSETESYDPGEGKIMADPVDVKGGFPKEVFRKPSKENGFPYFYNSEIASEDHYVVLYKDRFAHDKDSDIFWPDTGAKLMEGLQEILNCKTLIDLLAKSASKIITGGIMAGALKEKKTTEGNDKIKQSNKFNTLNKDGKDYTVLNAPVDKNREDHWITLNYYSDIRHKEEVQMRKMVCVDMGEGFRDVKLGSYVKLPNDSRYYVVVQIDMHSADVWQRNYDGFVGESTSLKDIPRQQSQVFYAIPLASNTVFYPPLLPDSPFRQSGPLPAFVVDSKDPYSHGRVRVRYPWQHEATAEKQAATSAEEAYKNAEKAYNNDDTAANKKAMNDAKDAWDKAEYELAVANAASPWIRMSTPMATSGGGMYFKPEKGDEVMVDFENGNIERPFVTGTLYSKNVPQPTQGSRVIVSRNGHTIKMSDPDNFAEFLAGMYPGMKFVTSFGVDLPDSLKDVGREVLGGIEMSDKWGLYKIKMSSHDRNITVSSPFGDVKINAFTGIRIEAPNGNIKIEGKNVDIVAGNRVRIVSGDNIKRGGFFGAYHKKPEQWLAALGEATSKALLQGFGADKFFDFSLIRSVLEVFIRPVDGTLELHSHRYLLLEAGGSKSYIETANYKNKTPEAVNSRMRDIDAIGYMFKYVGTRMDGFVSDFITRHNEVCSKLNALTNDTYILENPNSPAPQVTPTIITPANKVDLLKEILKLDPFNKKDSAARKAQKTAFCSDKLKFRGAPQLSPAEITDARGKVGALVDAVLDMKSLVLSYSYLYDGLVPSTHAKRVYNYMGSVAGSVFSHFKPRMDSVNEIHNLIKQDIQGQNDNLLYKDIEEYLSYMGKGGQPANAFATFFSAAGFAATKYDQVKQQLKRKIAFTLIQGLRSGKINPPSTVQFPADNSFDDNSTPYASNAPVGSNWAAYLGGVRVELSQAGGGSSFLHGLAKGASDTFLGGADTSLLRMEGDIWDPSAKGDILFSNSKLATYKFAKYSSGVVRYQSSELGDDVGDINDGADHLDGINQQLKNLLNY